MSRAQVIAHRGASGGAREPENSLAAFRAAVALAADAVELDVHATADGELVVHHDEAVPGSPPLATLAAEQVRALRLPNGEPVPTLAEALAVIGPRLDVWVEIKGLEPRWDGRLLDILDAGPNPARYAVHSFDHRIVRRLGERRPALRRGVLSASYPIRPLAPLADAGATVLWHEWQTVDRALVELVHGAGGQVIAWTVDDPERITALLALGVDGICTNHPDVVRRIVDARAA